MSGSKNYHWLGFAIIGWLWFRLVDELRVEWTVNPQYGYGWAVPFLCAYLIWENRVKRSTTRAAHIPSHFSPPVWLLGVVIAICALVYFPTRLILEANPGWRLFDWPLALVVVTLTLGLLYFILVPKPVANEQRRFEFRDFIFPVVFFLVAVPWPTWLEQHVIQGLTRLDAAASVELLGWFGIPAMAHGNVIEVATGPVGIDEACSGIRSVQATLMISLFLGEFYKLPMVRRVALVVAGFALALLFNLGRMMLLVWVAATKGISAIAAWHDPAGVTILLGCFFGLWGLGMMLRTKLPKSVGTTASNSMPMNLGWNVSERTFRWITVALIGWISLTEIGVESWYRWHEAKLPKAIEWTMAWPTNHSTFKKITLPPKTAEILRFDEGQSVAWSDTGGMWSAVFLRWNPGRTALHLAENHTPAVCLTAAGHNLKVISELEWVEIAEKNPLRLPFAIYEVADGVKPYYVFYCLWDDRASTQGFKTTGLKFENRMASVRAGLRNPGQRSLEIALAGPDSAPEAKATLKQKLEEMIQPGR